MKLKRWSEQAPGLQYLFLRILTLNSTVSALVSGRIRGIGSASLRGWRKLPLHVVLLDSSIAGEGRIVGARSVLRDMTVC